jgi:hypothetical protein
MKRKILLLVLVLLVIASAQAFSVGIGGMFSIDAIGGLPEGVLLSAKFDQVPFLMGLGLSIGEDVFSFAFLADWWAFNENLVSFLNIYAGPGLYFGVREVVDLGVRIPIGLNAFPLDFLELFVELAPTITAQIGDPTRFPVFGLQAGFGFRFWF